MIYLPPALLSAIRIKGLGPDEVRALLCRVRERLHDEAGEGQLIHPTLAAHIVATLQEETNDR